MSAPLLRHDLQFRVPATRCARKGNLSFLHSCSLLYSLLAPQKSLALQGAEILS